MSSWRSIPVSITELSLADVLPTGQAFRWHKTNEIPIEWTGVIGSRLYSLRQTNEELMFVNHNRDHNGGSRKLLDDDIDKDTKTLNEYFQLHTSCEKLVSDWSQKDRTIANVSKAALGVRILKQDPVETLIAFICSSNNNIPRITSMVNKLCIHYGTLLGIHSGKEFYSFPRLKDLIGESVEDKLRELGFGYRAKYVVNAARYILDNHGPHWLNSLREVAGYEEAWLALQDVPGVGPKVADCVCLMALGKAEAVPIDTHILQVAVKEYGVKVKGKSLTLRRYKEIGNLFRTKFGSHAGWAQAVLFRIEIR